MQDEVGVGDLLHGGAERLDQVVRQVPDEADGVGQGVDPAARRLRPAHGRVEGGEQRVLHQHARPGEPVEQRGLAGVGVAGDGHGRHLVALALLALGVAALLHVGDLLAELRHLLPDPAPVGLDLGLTGTAGGHAAAGGAGAATTHLPGERLAPAAQSRQHVLHLRERDLRLALAGLGVLGEDVQDQGRPVDDLDLDHVLQVDQLARGELTVADHGVGAAGGDDVAQVLGLAGTDVGGRVGLVTALDHAVQHLGAGRLGQGGELGHRVLRLLQGAVGPDPDEHHALQAELAVLDLGDVLELGGEAGDTAQRGALAAVVLVAVVVVAVVLVDGREVLVHEGFRPQTVDAARGVGLVAGVERGGHSVLRLLERVACARPYGRSCRESAQLPPRLPLGRGASYPSGPRFGLGLLCPENAAVRP